MKTNTPAIIGFFAIVIASLIGINFHSSTIYEEDLERQKAKYERRIASKQLQLDLTISSNRECREIVDTLDEKGYIEPRPIIIK